MAMAVRRLWWERRVRVGVARSVGAKRRGEQAGQGCGRGRCWRYNWVLALQLGFIVTIGYYRYTWVSSSQAGRVDHWGDCSTVEVTRPGFPALMARQWHLRNVEGALPVSGVTFFPRVPSFLGLAPARAPFAPGGLTRNIGIRHCRW